MGQLLSENEFSSLNRIHLSGLLHDDILYEKQEILTKKTRAERIPPYPRQHTARFLTSGDLTDSGSD